MDFETLIALLRAEAPLGAPPDAGALVPSTRAFHYYCATAREELAVIPLLARRWPAADDDADADGDAAAAPATDPDPLRDAARRLLAGNAHAVALATNPRVGGGLMDLAAAAAATDSTPVLRYDVVLGPSDVLAARAAGADALWLHVAPHDAAALASLSRLAKSLHMEAVIGVRDADELARALAAHPRFVGLHAAPPIGGPADLQRALALARMLPEGIAPIVFGGAASLADLRALHGVVDAVVVLPPFSFAPDLDALIERVNDSP